MITESSCLEIPTYLPNLYFRKYKLIQKLDGLRYGFPTMENPQTNANQPIPRSLTAWDKVLQDVASKVQVMKEVKKYKIAQKAFFARKCQRKYKRSELKKTQIYCYQRCLSSKLAERVMNKFKEFTVKEEDNQAQNEPNHQIIPSNENDAFIDEDDGLGFGLGFIQTGGNLLDDLFVQNIAQQMIQEPVVQENIQSHMKSVINQYGIGDSAKIRRSQFLNQIKECMRKRFKYKQKSMTANPPKTGGAELLLNNLIKAEIATEQQSGLVTTLPQEPTLNKNISTVSVNHDQKKRKRKQDQFTLNWSDDVFQQMKSMNQFVDRKATKIQNLNDMLSLYVIKDPKSQHYNKVFQKTIERFKEFPKTIQDIDVQEPKPNIRVMDSYFGTATQQSLSNEQFSIETLIDHFIEVSPFLFTEELDLSNRNYKVQIDPKHLFTVGSIKQKESIFFKFDKGVVEIIDEKFFLRESTPFGKLIKHTQLFFLIEYYLSKFGNQWGLITECIRVNPIVRGMDITSQQIENLHSYYNMKRKKNISFSDKVILPFRDQYEDIQSIKETKSDTNYDVSQDNYQSYIEKLMEREQDTEDDSQNNKDISYLGNKFTSFIKKSQNLGVNMKSNTFLDSIRDNMSNYFTSMIDNMTIVKSKQQGTELKADKDKQTKMAMFEPKEKPKSSKNNQSFKRRKMITEKTSPLVGVLQRKKTSGAGSYPYMRPDYAKKQQQTQQPPVPGVNVANPPITTLPKSEAVPPTKVAPKQFPTSKQKVEDKQKTTPKKIVAPEQKKAPGPSSAPGGATGKQPGSRRRKPDPKD